MRKRTELEGGDIGGAVFVYLIVGVTTSAGATYSNLEVDHLLGERRHFIVEAERVLAIALGSEDVVTLSLLGSVQDDLAARRSHGVVDIEGAAGLDLFVASVRTSPLQSSIAEQDEDKRIKRQDTNRKVECHLGVGLLNIGVEACLLVRLKPVGQGGCGNGGDQRGQAGEKSESHVG